MLAFHTLYSAMYEREEINTIGQNYPPSHGTLQMWHRRISSEHYKSYSMSNSVYTYILSVYDL